MFAEIIVIYVDGIIACVGVYAFPMVFEGIIAGGAIFEPCIILIH